MSVQRISELEELVRKLQAENDQLRQDLQHSVAEEYDPEAELTSLGPFGIFPNVTGVQLQLTPGGGMYVVAGPPGLQQQLSDVSETLGVLAGSLSPYSPITLSEQAKAKARIPVNATHFAFLYPLAGVSELTPQQKQMLDLTNPAVSLLVLGGFVYVREQRHGYPEQLVQVNTITKSSRDLFFGGPRELPAGCYSLLQKVGRLQPVTVAEFRQMGYVEFAWINPMEIFPGSFMNFLNINGGFAYVHKNRAKNKFFGVVPPPNEELGRPVEEVPRRIVPYSLICERRAQKEKVPQEEKEEEFSCVVCLDKRREFVMTPCGHFCMCNGCAATVVAGDGKCPMCRRPIEKAIGVFM